MYVKALERIQHCQKDLLKQLHQIQFQILLFANVKYLHMTTLQLLCLCFKTTDCMNTLYATKGRNKRFYLVRITPANKNRNLYLGSLTSCLVNLESMSGRATGVNQSDSVMPAAIRTC